MGAKSELSVSERRKGVLSPVRREEGANVLPGPGKTEPMQRAIMFSGRLLGKDLGHCGPTRTIRIEHVHKERPERTHACRETVAPVAVLCRGGKDALAGKLLP